MAKEIREYRCVIVWKETGEEDVGFVRLNPNIGPYDDIPANEEGILCTVKSWEDIRRLGKDDNDEKFVIKRVTL